MNGKILAIIVALAVVGSAVIMVADDFMKSEGEFEVVDDRGVSYFFDKPVLRIASLGKPFTQIIYELGAESTIVAVDTYSLDFADAHPELNDLSVGGSIFGLNVDMVLASEPDLILTYNYMSEGVVSRIAAMEAFIPVLAFNPQGYNEVIDLALKIGLLTGKSDEANLVANQMNSVRDEIILKVGAMPSSQKPRVYFELATYGESAANVGSISHDLIELAGGINVAFNAGLGSTYLTDDETVMSWKAQIIVLEAKHSYTTPVEVRDHYANPDEPEPKVHWFTNGYNTYDVNLMRGLMELAELFHPDLFDFS